MGVFDDLEIENLIAVAEFLLGVCYADGVFEGNAEDTILQMLVGALGEEADLPTEVGEAIEDFDEEGFDIELAGEPLTTVDDEIRLHVLRLTAALHGLSGAAAVEDFVIARAAEALDVEVELLDDFDALDFSAAGPAE